MMALGSIRQRPTARLVPAWGLLPARFSSSGGTPTDKDKDKDKDALVEEDNEGDLLLTTSQPMSSEPANVWIIQPKFASNKLQKDRDPVLQIDEAQGLAEAIGNWTVVRKTFQPIKHLDGGRFFGKGKVEEFKQILLAEPPESKTTAVFVNTLLISPNQQRLLEDEWGVNVYDRFSIILKIFQSRAVSKEAKLQVELAHIPYLRSRVVQGVDAGFDRQRGGLNAVGGGGETELERERRRLTDREIRLKKRLEVARERRETSRHDRTKHGIPVVALVGYTNVGKTALLRALTGDESAQPKDMLFATLDTAVRSVKLPSGLKAVVVDTVGFITDLPHSLVAAFKSTLEDVIHADLILHVRDCTHPNLEEHAKTVESVLKELGQSEDKIKNCIQVFNKADMLGPKQSIAVDEDATAVLVSCKTMSGIHMLARTIDLRLQHLTGRAQYELNVPLDDPDQLSFLYREGTITESAPNDDGKTMRMTVIMDQQARNKFVAKWRKGEGK